MKTIGAKELRLNLDKILDDVLAGEEILVKHRFKAPVRLQAVYDKPTVYTAKRADPMPGLTDNWEKAKKLRPPPFDPHKSIKELYKESIAKKYGVK